jgi:hypothetical protein
MAKGYVTREMPQGQDMAAWLTKVAWDEGLRPLQMLGGVGRIVWVFEVQASALTAYEMDLAAGALEAMTGLAASDRATVLEMRTAARKLREIAAERRRV